MRAYVELSKIALRLKRSIIATTIAILTLGISLGAVTAILSVSNAIANRPFPYRDYKHLARMQFVSSKGPSAFVSINPDGLDELIKSGAIDSGFLCRSSTTLASSTGQQVQVHLVEATRQMFSVLGVAAEMGRALSPDPRLADADANAVVISNDAWRRVFDRRPDVIGSTVWVDKNHYTVVGVMPPRFRWLDADLYITLRPSANTTIYPLFVRTKTIADEESALRTMQFLRQYIGKLEDDRLPDDLKLRTVRIGEPGLSRVQSKVSILKAGTILLLLLSLANLAILFISQASRRQKEIALRLAFGSTRRSVLLETIKDVIVIIAIAGVVGTTAAYEFLRNSSLWLPASLLPSEVSLNGDMSVLVICVVSTLCTGAFVSVSFTGALLLKPESSARLLKSGVSTLSRGAAIAYQCLLTVQLYVGIILISLSAATLLYVRQINLQNYGFQTKNIVAASYSFPNELFGSWSERVSQLTRIREKLKTLPGVSDVTIDSSYPPFSSLNVQMRIVGESSESDPFNRITFSAVDSEFFNTFGIGVRGGRIFSNADLGAPNYVCIISMSLAKRFYPNADALGRMIYLPALAMGYSNVARPKTAQSSARIIGVVDDLHYFGQSTDSSLAVYVPYTLFLSGDGWINVGMKKKFAVLADVDRVLKDAAPNMILSASTKVSDLIDKRLFESDILLSRLFVAFALIATIVSIGGSFSVLSSLSFRRTREYAIRISLGESKMQIVCRVLFLAWSAAGVAGTLALLCAFVVVYLSDTVGLPTNDLVFVVPIAMLVQGLVASVAGLQPALRASRISPFDILREEG